jgi:hypothetical protein
LGEEGVDHPHGHAELLHAANDLASIFFVRVVQFGWHDWPRRGSVGTTSLGPRIWELANKVRDVAAEALSPKAPVQPVRRRLETPEQLRQLKHMTNECAARIWGFVDEAGQPDVRRAARALAGKDEPTPEYAEEAGVAAAPDLPHTGLLAYLADELQKRRPET